MIDGIVEQQSQIIKQIKVIGETKEAITPKGLLPVVDNFDALARTYALGELGDNLWKFANEVDHTHPDLAELFDGSLVDGKFCDDCIGTLTLAQKGIEANVNPRILERLNRAAIYVEENRQVYKDMVRSLAPPSSSLQFVRFLPSWESRQATRENKERQVVAINDVLSKRDSDYWHNQPKDFSSLIRNHNRYEADLVEAETQKQYFQDHSLASMCSELDVSIKKIEETYASQVYYGFNKTNFTSASVILAKMCGYHFFYDESPMGLSKMATIVCKEPYERCWIPAIGFKPDEVSYEPRAYTLNELWDETSDETKDLVRYLEEFPEAAGKPIFDHFRILIPGLYFWHDYDVDEKYRNDFSYRAPDGHCVSLKNLGEAHKSLDLTLIKDGYITGVLLGERDGEMFFVSYWN